MEKQDKKFSALEENIKNIPDNVNLFQDLMSEIHGLRDDIKDSRFLTEKMQAFSARLDTVMTQLKQPAETKLLRHTMFLTHYITLT